MAGRWSSGGYTISFFEKFPLTFDILDLFTYIFSFYSLQYPLHIPTYIAHLDVILISYICVECAM